MPTSSCPAGRLDPPRSTMGQGKEMRRVPCTPRDSNSMSHTALRCRCRPSGPGGTCWVQAGSGCLAARVTRPKGGVVVGAAQLVAGRLGHHHLARHMPPGGAGLAASRTSRALRPLTAHTAGLAWCPSTAGACGLVATGAFGGLGVLLRQSGPGLVLALGVVPNIRRPSGERDLHADVGRCARHKLRKGEWTRGNARAKGANWTKFTGFRTNFT